MRSILYILLAIQLSFSLVLAQITFTREWVAGKRAPPTNTINLQNNPENPHCKSLWPAIEILMETERVRQVHCDLHSKPARFLAHMKEDFPRVFYKPSEDSDFGQFEDDATTTQGKKP